MRLLHTADWHLGRSFHGHSLLREQEAVLDWMVEVAREQRVDGILVSGDLYDRALPPVDAVRLLDDALARLSAVAPVVAISGNHDSAPRLGFGSALLERAGLWLRTDPARVADPVMLGDVAVYGVPYLEPQAVAGELEAAANHGAVLTAALDRVRRDLAGRPAGTRSIVLAHAFVAGAAESESERDLTVGGTASVPPSVFAGVDYVALGHLHGPQSVGLNGRYAGSPVAFSFSEASDRKSVAIVELAAAPGGPHTVELVRAPASRPLVSLRGTLEELLVDPAHAPAEAAWVRATLTDPVRALDAMDRLRLRFPHTAALEFDPQGASATFAGSYAERLRDLDDAELAARFVEDVRGTAPDDDERRLLEDALDARRRAEAKV